MKKLFLLLCISSAVITSIYGEPPKKLSTKVKEAGTHLFNKAKASPHKLTLAGAASLGMGIWQFRKGCTAATSIFGAIKQAQVAENLSKGAQYNKVLGLGFSLIGGAILLYETHVLKREVKKLQENKTTLPN